LQSPIAAKISSSPEPNGINSIDLENVAVAHLHVAEAAVITVPHPCWARRPSLIVATHPNRHSHRDELIAFSRTSASALDAA